MIPSTGMLMIPIAVVTIPLLSDSISVHYLPRFGTWLWVHPWTNSICFNIITDRVQWRVLTLTLGSGKQSKVNLFSVWGSMTSQNVLRTSARYRSLVGHFNRHVYMSRSSTIQGAREWHEAKLIQKWNPRSEDTKSWQISVWMLRNAPASEDQKQKRMRGSEEKSDIITLPWRGIAAKLLAWIHQEINHPSC
jgi:hypothetical protein